jgi:histidine triad (HIT) family protein
MMSKQLSSEASSVDSMGGTAVKEDCIFCKIISGAFGTDFVYQDEYVVAFDDISPQMPVHTLIVPREHYANLNEDIPADVLGHVFGAAKKVAEIKGISDSGYRIIQNNGANAGQTVFHLHVHVLGGRSLGEGLVVSDNPEV